MRDEKPDERANMSFKKNLQYLRGSRNMTQEQLAMLMGVSRQAISKWESEKAYPEMDKLLMICDMFGVTLDELVMGDVRASAGYGVWNTWTWLLIRPVWPRRLGWWAMLLARFRGQSGLRHRRSQECPILGNRIHRVPNPVFNCPFLQNRTCEMGWTFRKTCPEISCRMWLAMTVI